MSGAARSACFRPALHDSCRWEEKGMRRAAARGTRRSRPPRRAIAVRASRLRRLVKRLDEVRRYVEFSLSDDDSDSRNERSAAARAPARAAFDTRGREAAVATS
jgi:hypothetical protein